MKEELYKILEEAKKEIGNIRDFVELEKARIKFLGKKGPIKDVLGKLGSIGEELRKEIGRVANEVKDEITRLIDETEENLRRMQKETQLKTGVSDISLPLKKLDAGYPHPISLVIEKMVSIFKSMGYSVADGPELEEEYYNFDMLNIPPYHPARDDHDSFYVTKGRLLRTHTSPVQIRTMLNTKPPIAIVVPGRCYRRDATDATHSHTFYQMEGLVVDKGISFADLKGTLLLWAKMMFGEETQIRLRPDFFPFTEPSAELAVTCPVCKGKKCNVCKHTGWVELMGCGMVDPIVLENCGIDPDIYSGFAFGLGIERVAMTVYGINDIRQFYENDIRLLEQFSR
ncbi:MAG: phenylalanine--tRNA ligase subunit alpha [Brevinematia bacterium]